jgi:hypothetical protein
MRKDFVDQIERLRQSVGEIMGSGVDNREELLGKSFEQFSTALGETVAMVYGDEPEPLAKGLNHIATFASALNRLNQVINAIKTGRPGYMMDGNDGAPSEPLPDEIASDLDGFLSNGVLVLRSMVNNSVELPTTDAELRRAEAAGELVKLETSLGEMLLKTALPDDLREYLSDPVELILDRVDLAREHITMAKRIAGDLASAGMEFDPEMVEACPEVFVLENDGLTKAGAPFPPKKRPVAGGSSGAETPPRSSTGAAQNTGGTADDGPDDVSGDGADDQGQGDEPSDLTDDLPQDPIEMCIRLNSMAVVILGSIQKGMGSGANPGQGADPAANGSLVGNPMDPRNVGLQRSAGLAIGDVPLAKIFDGEVEVHPSLADYLDSMEQLAKKLGLPASTRLAKRVDELLRADEAAKTELAKRDGELAEARRTIADLRKMSGDVKGIARHVPSVPVTKMDDAGGGGASGGVAEVLEKRVVELATSGLSESAQHEAIKLIHVRQGSPLPHDGLV